MIRIAAWCRRWDDSFLRAVTQLGVDSLDHVPVPHVPGEGYPDLDGLLEVRKRVRSWGMDWNRLSLPVLSEEFMRGEDGFEAELEPVVKTMQVYAEAGVPIIRAAFANDRFPWMSKHYETTHRGGYVYGGQSKGMAEDKSGPPSQETLDTWWQQFCFAYERLVPIAEDYSTKLVMHPSDCPHPDTPFGSLGFHRIIDAFPSRSVGYMYCCGTRAEAGGLPLVLDEIHNYGRKGRLCTVHFRNVRGSFPTAGGYEEVLLDDGDMNMFKIVRALKEVGFAGCLNADHIPPLEGDDNDTTFQGLAYSVGYMKALLAAAAA